MTRTATPSEKSGRPGSSREERLARFFAEPGPRQVAVGLAVLIGLLTLSTLGEWGFTTDDAYITLRYARNFVEGHGLVFNPGGARIEGYSNPILLFVSALALKCGWDPLIVIKLLSAVALTAMLLATYALGRGLGAGVWPCVAGLMLVGSFPGVQYWVYSGLETVLYMSLVAGGAAVLLRQGTVTRGQAVGAGVLLGLAAWTRIEGGLYAALAVFACAAYGLRHRKTSPHFWCAVPIAVAGVSLLAFRLSYYGRILPNTYYCKADGEPWALVGQFLSQAGLIWALALFRRPAGWGWKQLLLLGACLVHVLLYRQASTLVGHHSRHFLVLLPLLAALAASSLQAFPRTVRVVGTELLAIYAVVMVLIPQHETRIGDYRKRTEARVKVAEFLNRNSSPEDQVMVADVGVIGYYLRRPIVDPLCLVDEYYAPCFRNDAGAFVQHAMTQRRPRWLVIHSGDAEELTEIEFNPNQMEIIRSPEFGRYVRRTTIPAGRFGYYHLMERETGARPFEAVKEPSAHRPCPRG